MQAVGDFLDKTYWGNTAWAWAFAFFGVLFAIVFSKIAFRLFKYIGQKVSSKTETKVDDVIFDAMEEPASLVVGFALASLSLSTLKLPKFLDNVMEQSFYFAYVFIGAWLCDRVITCLFKEVVQPFVEKTDNDMDDQLLPIVRRGMRTIVWTMAVVIGINNAGYDVGALIAGLGIGGLAFALAAQDTVQNLFGGVTIFMDQPFKINDRIKVEGFDGTIVEIGTRSTRLKTLDGRIVTLPNSKFTDQAVENVSSEPSRKVTVGLGLTYDMSADQIENSLKVLRQIAFDTPGVEEKCLAFFENFGDFSLNIKLIYYIEKDANILDVMTQVNLRILREFAKAGLEMAFPTHTLYHIGSTTYEAKKSA